MPDKQYANAQPKPVREKSESRLAWCRRQPCLLLASNCEHDCAGPVNAHHIRFEGEGGMGTKPSDFQTLPLCRFAHSVYHEVGRDQFYQIYGVSLSAAIIKHNARYWKEHPKVREKRPRVKTDRLQVLCGTCDKAHRVTGGRFWCVRRRQYIAA